MSNSTAAPTTAGAAPSDGLADIHADLSERVVVDTHAMAWEDSPSGTVQRKPLYREGGEFGPVTSVVRYAPGGAFAEHTHPEGEEILVLEGVFSDEHGDYPAGTFLMNPHGSRHSPRSEPGCTLFVRLRQYPGADRPRLVEDTADGWRPGLVDGLGVRPLYAQGGYPESMALVRWQPGTHFQRHTHWGGEEILVLEGEFADEHGRYPAGTWIRSPHLSAHTPFSDTGCLIYVRVGGL
ncbi:MAG: cupin domain-containing protein [Thiohalocapsa sp.]|nr:cupin domain-containing protein [Thiohalocapsa sp.]MCF7990136.1 cupin domain-containing protein [Thiohalocapsa sp.]